MRVFIMRHGQAEMVAPSDEQRALTKQGRFESAKMAQWLSEQLDSLDTILVSPYVRAQQTLETIQPLLPACENVIQLDELVPGGNVAHMADFITGLAHEELSTVLIVSHLPLVGYLVGELAPPAGAPIFATSGIAGLEVSLDKPGQLLFLDGPHTLF